MTAIDPQRAGGPRPAPGSVVSLALAIERDDVVRLLGYPEGKRPPERIAALLEPTLTEARRLACARGASVSVPIARAHELGLDAQAATGLVVGLVTIGPALEARVAELLRAGEATEALLLDASGSAAAEEAADQLGALLADAAVDGPRSTASGAVLRSGVAAASSLARASRLSCRISPGYGNWPITAQRALFDVVPHAEVGVELLPTMLMAPCKSISFAMWLGADARPIAGLSGCARCELERCRYRRARET